MYTISGKVHSFEWGSTDLIAETMKRGRPSPSREAEAWFGAHPSGPSPVPELQGEPAASLKDVIQRDPQGELGPGLQRLPFLMKLLAAEKALSIQAHPSKRQAEEGFARENALGLALEDPDRNYRDDNHKPELLIAINEFHALAGFRPVASTVELLRELEVPSLSEELELLDAAKGDTQREGDALREVLGRWLNLEEEEAQRRVSELVGICERYVASGRGDEHLALIAETVLQLHAGFGADPGILVSLLLNHVTLQRGEAIFLAAGQLHAYLSGLGVEVMANSNNVLRGGLTAKHMDVAELLNILDATPLPNPRCAQVDGVYQTPVSDFKMRTLTLGESCRVTGPAVVLSVHGLLQLESDTERREIQSGEGAWIGFRDGSVLVSALQADMAWDEAAEAENLDRAGAYTRHEVAPVQAGDPVAFIVTLGEE